MTEEPHIKLSMPYPENEADLVPLISEMRKQLVSAGMTWAEFVKDEETNQLHASGWPDKPPGAEDKG